VGREALLFHLLHRDLSSFDVSDVPQTGALAEQKSQTRRGIDRLIEQIAHDGRLPSAHLTYLGVAITSGEEEGRGFYHQARVLVPDLRYDSTTMLARRLKEWGCEPWKSGPQRGIKFPALVELRARFDKKHGPQEWPVFDASADPEWEGV